MLAAGDCTSLEPRPEPSQVEGTLPRVLTALSFVLERLVARNDRLLESLSGQLNGLGGHRWAMLGKSLNGFHGVRPPNISIPKYLERIYKYTGCSPSCFVVGYVYIDRLLHKHPDSLVGSLNVHRLLVTSVMVASKMLDDEHYNNAFYAKVGGVSNAELNRLEMELLFLLDFGVVVSSRVFETYCFHLEREVLLNGHGEHGKIEKALFDPAPLDDVTELPVVEDALATADPPALDQAVD
ncbi:cyclin-U1-1 [Eucalyptus grandis]|uniref:cyclin-U1-1 n=1 Tax=Eucalyptus grandis TaxID=71139 RepID=UPI00192F03E2|nr:cyclin-U1-1 [Eucalyptus grandis]